uniref:ARID domain-containing protein n=1 Tax=Pygocentrus nattereri TaxID=42514 RepID=A0AAR2J7G3_PYGNA
FQVADEPAYLTVGTDVSAKYRGAFCEAKIKTVKRMVKVKVNYNDTLLYIMVYVIFMYVSSCCQVGSTVEVKSPEGVFSEAVISKLTDASWYTVVFDDGDEKTLRRTSLCLKGERHFAESETLDQLPLTNPEHFGTPVIGKKTNRGRRSSQAVAEEEKESSSSEEEDDDRRRLNDDLLGKVAFIQTGPERASWYHALVVSPSCNDDLTVKKDQCLVRSFTKKVPDGWKMDMSEILESSSSDDGEGKESEEEEKEPEPEEPDDEPDPEERDHFLQQLYKFMEDRGTPINKPPVLGYKDLNLFKLFRLVYQHGGCDSIESGSIWKQVYMDLGIPVLNSAASYNVKTAYRKYLYGFEEYCRSAKIEFRTVHHNEPRPVTQPEMEIVKQEMVEENEEKCDPTQQTKAELEQCKDKADGDESDADDEKSRKDICSPRVSEGFFLSPDEREDEDRYEDSEHSVTGTKVKVKYGKGKSQKIYEANIKNTETDDGEVLYLVHYYGWNVRYDEWVKADRIIWPVDKGGTKKRQKKKVKNKDDCEKEKEEDKQTKTGVKRGRPPLKSTPPSTSRSISKTPSSEGRSGSKSSQESECEDSPEKKPGWTETTDPATARKQEEEEARQEEKRRLEAAQAEPECPSSPQEKLLPQEKSEVDKPEEEIAPSPESDDKSPKSRGKRARQREPGSETPTQLPATPNHAEPEAHCTVPLPEKADSDTDSATEDVSPPERSCIAKRKATEQRTPDKKVRLERKEEPKTQPKTLSPEKRSDTERQVEAVEKMEETLVKTEMPSLTREVQVRVEPLPGLLTIEDASGVTDEELMPRIGPEALVCHEVDLDDPEEKEKPSGEELPVMREENAPAPVAAQPHLAGAGAPRLCSPSSTPSPDESHSIKSESDATIEVDSVAESQEGLGENGSPHGFDASASSSNSSISLQERDGKDRGQKRLLDCNMTSPAKKQKRNQKRLSTASTAEKNGAGHSSDSEDLPAIDTSNKLTPVKHSNLTKAQKLSRSPGLASPSSKDMEKDKHKDKQSFSSARSYKWTFQLNELDNMSSAERIAFLQEKLQEIRKYYMSLKSEVASIDRRRKRLKKKEREVSHTTASTSSGSSDTGMSPSSASPTQNTVAVECR